MLLINLIINWKLTTTFKEQLNPLFIFNLHQLINAEFGVRSNLTFLNPIF